jgi:hypothetical protein
MIFYTYIYYDTSRNNEPFYVGKGFGERAWIHLKESQQTKTPFYNRLKSMKNKNIDPVIGIYAGLDEEFAHLLEEELISKFGRKDLGLGTLCNLTNGGEGMSNPSTETRSKISAANSNRTVSEETKRKMSESHKGKTHTLESNIKRSEALKGRKISEEQKQAIGNANRGENNGMFGKESSFKGKSHSDDTKIKIRKARSEQIITEETKKKMAESQKRRHQLKKDKEKQK